MPQSTHKRCDHTNNVITQTIQACRTACTWQNRWRATKKAVTATSHRSNQPSGAPITRSGVPPSSAMSSGMTSDVNCSKYGHRSNRLIQCLITSASPTCSRVGIHTYMLTHYIHTCIYIYHIPHDANSKLSRRKQCAIVLPVCIRTSIGSSEGDSKDARVLAAHDAFDALVARRAPGIRDESRDHHNVAAQVVQASQGVALHHLSLQRPHLVQNVHHLAVGWLWSNPRFNILRSMMI